MKHTAKLEAELGNLEDWRFTGHVDYHPEESLDDWFCVCGARILYAHQIRHTVTGDIATVGSECVGQFRRSGREKAKNAQIGARYTYMVNSGICLRCEGTGKWINPNNSVDVRVCFRCNGTGKSI